MRATFFILMLAAMAAVVVVLFLGLFAMAKGGETNARYGNRLMRLRVLLQGLALLLFAAALLAH